jgi:chromosome segregation ATPase
MSNVKQHSASGKISNTPLTYSKANFQVLEQERNLLKITLDYVAGENEQLKQQLEDMKMTVKHNKELLKEYVEKITNKDKVFEKMNAQIEQLTSRLHTLEEFTRSR